MNTATITFSVNVGRHGVDAAREYVCTEPMNVVTALRWAFPWPS
jgi:hypothetical protein